MRRLFSVLIALLLASPAFAQIIRVPSQVQSVTGTANQIICTTTNEKTVCGTPQDIATTSTPQFAGVGLGGAAGASGLTFYGSKSGSLLFAVPASAGTGSQITWPAGTVDFSATGGTSYFVKQSSAGAAFTVGQPTFADLSDGTTLGLVSLTGPVTLSETTTNGFRSLMAVPATPTATPDNGSGSLAAGVYQISVVGVDPAGNTSCPYAGCGVATYVSGTTTGGTSHIDVAYVAPEGASSTRVYVSAVNGATPIQYFTSTSATTYALTTLAGATVAALPTTNTAYRMNLGGWTTANWLGRAIYLPDGTAALPAMAFASDTDTGIWRIADNVLAVAGGATTSIGIGYYGPRLASAAQLGWSSDSSVINPADLILTREAAAVLQQGVDAAGVTNQMFKGPDRITSAGVGGNLTFAGGRGFDAQVGGSLIFQTAPAAGAGVAGILATALTIDSTKKAVFAGAVQTGAGITFSPTAPTISSGFGTNPSIVANNGTAAFTVNVGTGGTATGGVVGLPTATTGWACSAADITTPASFVTVQTATAATTATFANYARTTGLLIAWTASDVLSVQCVGY